VWRACIRVRVTAGRRGYRVTIDDTGIGLPADGRDRLTDPYVTTRKKGTGLGLAIVQKIVEQHSGTLGLGDAPAASGFDGAEITLHLPRPFVRGDRTGPGALAAPGPRETAEVGENG
jgi:two-component system nitrogen regulation sensor histidine kinase NtrY